MSYAHQYERCRLGDDEQPTSGGYRRLAIAFAVHGDLRYLSHREMLRLFARAIARADLPVRFSDGFNPRPRISIPLPRPVGVESDDERLIVTTGAPIEPSEFSGRLASEMPDGISVRGSRALEPGEPLTPLLVRYRVSTLALEPSVSPSDAARLMRDVPIPFDRYVHKASRHKTVDLRPYLHAVSVGSDHVDMTLRVTAEGSAKPAEICNLLGISGTAINHRIRRTEVTWQQKPKPTTSNRLLTRNPDDVAKEENVSLQQQPRTQAARPRSTATAPSNPPA